MQIEFLDDVIPILMESTFIESVSIKGSDEGILLRSLAEEDVPEILNLLNSIANQGITSINVYTYSYTIDGLTLSYDNLSTSESLFLLSYAANKAKIKTFFCDDITQLSEKTLLKYMSYFKDSEYVNFVYKDDSMKYYYKVLMEGVCNA